MFYNSVFYNRLILAEERWNVNDFPVCFVLFVCLRDWFFFGYLLFVFLCVCFFCFCFFLKLKTNIF